jgi:hypothetical protein
MVDLLLGGFRGGGAQNAPAAAIPSRLLYGVERSGAGRVD